jgi:dihydrofolate synthase/folylpolyglutamate synthase
MTHSYNRKEGNMSSANGSYLSAVEYLNGFQVHGFRLGLERMDAVLAALGNPHMAYPCIHVAGTNGKGSVCAITAGILSAAGSRVGMYISPHLHSVRERFRIGGGMISESDLCRLILKIRELVEAGYELSYFEYTTTVAMVWFAEQGVDLAVFETGLGGRLDATNVVRPLVSVITNISLEHCSFLGRTIPEIAREKAGIIKENVPVISGVADVPARSVIRGKSLELDAPLSELGRGFTVRRNGDGTLDFRGRKWEINGLELALMGDHQMANAGLAIAACERLGGAGFRIPEAAVRSGCRAVSWPCRAEFLRGSCLVLLDGAHNPDGVRTLKAFLEELFAGEGAGGVRRTLLWACSNEGGDKDFVSMLKEIAPFFQRCIITEPAGPRKPVTVEDWQKAGVPGGVCLMEDWREAVDACLSGSCSSGFLCAAGSLYLVGAVRTRLMERGFMG